MTVLKMNICVVGVIFLSLTRNACQTSVVQRSAFVPDVYITRQVPMDRYYIDKIRDLFFEPARSVVGQRRAVYNKAIKKYGGQEVILLTDDDVRISALYFKRTQARINLIYIPGYFFDMTPSKEWGAPFAGLFDDCNVLIIDWRGVGDSEGVCSMIRKNSFGKNAYHDIQAAIEFVKRDNAYPVVVIGFCCGGALALYATIQAQKEGRAVADALALDCIFSTFEQQFNRAVAAENRCWMRMLSNLGLARFLMTYRMDGNIFELNPIDMIKEIKIPCYFEHYAADPYAPLEENIAVYQAAACQKMFMLSDEGRHVRMHTKIPYQYREAFLLFLRKLNFLPAQDSA
jgi:dienelactone hydrolase